jgi:hypothetical protein
MDGSTIENVDCINKLTGEGGWLLFCWDADSFKISESLVEPVEITCESAKLEPVNSFARDLVVTGIAMNSIVSLSLMLQQKEVRNAVIVN